MEEIRQCNRAEDASDEGGVLPPESVVPPRRVAARVKGGVARDDNRLFPAARRGWGVMSSLSLVTDAFVAKPEAIDLLEIALGVSADRRKPAEVYLYTPHGSVLTIEVPKYGEDLPLTLDLSADVPDEELERQAGELSAVLQETLGWSCHILGRG